MSDREMTEELYKRLHGYLMDVCFFEWDQMYLASAIFKTICYINDWGNKSVHVRKMLRRLFDDCEISNFNVSFDEFVEMMEKI